MDIYNQGEENIPGPHSTPAQWRALLSPGRGGPGRPGSWQSGSGWTQSGWGLDLGTVSVILNTEQLTSRNTLIGLLILWIQDLKIIHRKEELCFRFITIFSGSNSEV